MCVTSIHESQISVCFALRPAVYEIRYNFEIEINALNDPKITLNPARSNLLSICIASIPESQMFRSMTIRFRDTGYFKKSAPSDPKMTLNHTRSNVPHKCVTRLTLKSQSQKYLIYTK